VFLCLIGFQIFQCFFLKKEGHNSLKDPGLSMTKRLQSKFKINRRYGVNLWGRAKSPVNARDYKPGQHGQKGAMGQAKVSNYGLQLAAKQKLRGYYGNIGERQFRRFYKEAARRKGDTGEIFLGLLERRLDAMIYRMKFVPTVFAARQFVNHGHVQVNGKRVNIASYIVQDNDEIQIIEKSRQLPLVLTAVQSNEREVPDYLEVDHKHMKGKLLRTPGHGDIPFPIHMDTSLIVELYSRRVKS
jgi:small subunit ribosomal protein S4